MKKFLILSAIAVLALSATAFAGSEKGVINSSASVNKSITPDTVELSIAVISTDKQSMQTATKKNKELTEKLYKAMKEMINPENNDYVKTSDLSAQPIYEYANNKRTFSRYEVSNVMTVSTKNVDKTGKIIDKAISLGASRIDNLNFTLSSYEAQCDEMLLTATRKTRVRAENIAKTAGTRILGVQSIDGSCSTSNNTNRRVYYNMMAKSAMADGVEAAGSSVPIESGSMKIFANINASYFVK